MVGERLLSQGTANLVIDRMNKMQEEYSCDICKLPGHRAGYCWVNSQLWDAHRNNPELKKAWKEYRAMIRFRG